MFQFTELQEKWLRALESGKYPQCHGELCNREGTCCLGVACLIVGRRSGRRFKRDNAYLDDESVLSRTFADELGLRDEYGGFLVPFEGCTALSEMNDDGATFLEIAAYIRANPENVFVAPEAAQSAERSSEGC